MHVHPSIVCDVFPIVIKQLGPSAKKPITEKIVAEINQALAKIQKDQKQHEIRRSKMSVEGLQELSKAFIDGDEDFKSVGHHKGM